MGRGGGRSNERVVILRVGRWGKGRKDKGCKRVGGARQRQGADLRCATSGSKTVAKRSEQKKRKCKIEKSVAHTRS